MTAAYLGSWVLDRWILDHVKVGTTRCTGSAELRRSGAALVYDEHVSFRLAGKAIRATRRYRFLGSENTILATFADESPFFHLRLGADGIGRALHRCGDDDYRLTLTLREPATWQTIWEITGTKRLRIVTHYRR